MIIKKDSGVIYVKDFGAKGDGVTNDTIAIRKAIESAQNGSTIYFDGIHPVEQIFMRGIDYKNLILRGSSNGAELKLIPNVSSVEEVGIISDLKYTVRDYYEELQVSNLGWKIEKIQLSTGRIFNYIAVEDKNQIPSSLTNRDNNYGEIFIKGAKSHTKYEVASVDMDNPDGVGTARIYMFEPTNFEKKYIVLEENSSGELIENLQVTLNIVKRKTYAINLGESDVPDFIKGNLKITQPNGKSARVNRIEKYIDSKGKTNNIIIIDSFSEYQKKHQFFDAPVNPLDDNLDLLVEDYDVHYTSLGSLNRFENITFENLIFDGCNYEVGKYEENRNDWNIIYTGASKNVTIDNCVFKNSIMAGVHIGGSGNSYSPFSDFPENVRIVNCQFENNGRNDIEVIYGRDIVIDGCNGDGHIDIEANGDELVYVSVTNSNFHGFEPYSPSDITSASRVNVTNCRFYYAHSQVGISAKMVNCSIHEASIYNGNSTTFNGCTINRFRGHHGGTATKFYNCDIYDLPRGGASNWQIGDEDYFHFIGCTIDLSLVEDMWSTDFAIHMDNTVIVSETTTRRISRSFNEDSRWNNSIIKNIEFHGANQTGDIIAKNCDFLLKDGYEEKVTLLSGGGGKSVTLEKCFIQGDLNLYWASIKVMDCILDGETKPKVSAFEGIYINGLKSTNANGIDWWDWTANTNPGYYLEFRDVHISKELIDIFPLGIGRGNQGRPDVDNVIEGCTAIISDSTEIHSLVMYNNVGSLDFRFVYYDGVDKEEIEVETGIPNNGKAYSLGHVIKNPNPYAGGYMGWVCTQSGIAITDEWRLNAYYWRDIFVKGNYVYETISLGIVYDMDANLPEIFGEAIEDGPKEVIIWAANKQFKVGDITTDGENYYLCTTGGLSGSTEPEWYFDWRDYVSDNQVVWLNMHFGTYKNIGTKAIFKPYGLISE